MHSLEPWPLDQLIVNLTQGDILRRLVEPRRVTSRPDVRESSSAGEVFVGGSIQRKGCRGGGGAGAGHGATAPRERGDVDGTGPADGAAGLHENGKGGHVR